MRFLCFEQARIGMRNTFAAAILCILVATAPSAMAIDLPEPSEEIIDALVGEIDSNEVDVVDVELDSEPGSNEQQDEDGASDDSHGRTALWELNPDDAVDPAMMTLHAVTDLLEESIVLEPEQETESAADSEEDDVKPMSTGTTTFSDSGNDAGLHAGLVAAGFAAAAATKAGWIRILLAPIATLFSRFRGQELLDHPRRAELHELICQTPGITVPDLAHASGLSRNTVIHHLRMLEKEHLIVSNAVGRTVHWFENGGRYGREHKAAYAVLQDDRSRDVADFVAKNPGATQRQVAEGLGLSPSVITWHLQRLEAASLVDRRKQGRTMECFPCATLAQVAL